MAVKKLHFWIGILLIALSHFFLDFMIGIWAAYKTAVTLDLFIAGLIASSAMLIGEGLQLYFGILSDRGFHQKLLALGIGLSVAVPFLSYTDNPWILFLCVLCCFIGSGAFHPAAARMLLGWSSNGSSFFVTLFLCIGTIGAALSQSIFMYVYSHFEGQTWLFAIPIVLLAIGCYFFKFPAVEQHSEKVDFKQMWKMLKPYRRELSLLYVIQVFFLIVVLAFGFLLPDILRVKGYEDWFCLGGGGFCLVIGTALATIPAGLCVDRFGYKYTLVAMIILSSVFVHVFLGLSSLSLIPTAVLLMSLGAVTGTSIPVIVAGGNSCVPSGSGGFISALYMGGAGCLAGISPTLAGFMTSLFTDNAPVIALQLLSLLLILALGLVYLLPEPTKQATWEQKSIKVNI